MIEKGKEIVTEHPFIGVGPNNFKYYKSELTAYSNSAQFDRLQSVSYRKLSEDTSAHNTYLQAITEFGILGFIIFLIIILKPIFFILQQFISNKLKTEHLLLVSLIGMSIHFFTVANLSGALPWFIIGLSWSFLQPQKHKI
jgi:O-antigen ligase